MTREQLEKANKIDEDIKALLRLDRVLVSASVDKRKLAAVSNDLDIIICSEAIPANILAKFRAILSDEAKRLDAEFESL